MSTQAQSMQERFKLCLRNHDHVGVDWTIWDSKDESREVKQYRSTEFHSAEGLIAFSFRDNSGLILDANRNNCPDRVKIILSNVPDVQEEALNLAQERDWPLLDHTVEPPYNPDYMECLKALHSVPGCDHIHMIWSSKEPRIDQIEFTYSDFVRAFTIVRTYLPGEKRPRWTVGWERNKIKTPIGPELFRTVPEAITTVAKYYSRN